MAAKSNRLASTEFHGQVTWELDGQDDAILTSTILIPVLNSLNELVKVLKKIHTREKLMFVIGVTGYCQPTKFNREEAWDLLDKAFNDIANKNKDEDILVLGGLTDIPSIHQAAYYMARRRGWNVGGIACKKAEAFKWFPMSTDGDVLKIVGETWGEESEEFVSRCDALIRIGGGKHAINESELAKAKGIQVIEKEIK